MQMIVMNLEIPASQSPKKNRKKKSKKSLERRMWKRMMSLVPLPLGP
jgi:hypothetical protein